MGEYHIEEFIPRRDDTDNILHPRHTRPGIPSVYTFYSIVQNRVGSQYGAIQQWCNENAWFESSPTCDFWVADCPSIGGDYQSLYQLVQRRCSRKDRD